MTEAQRDRQAIRFEVERFYADYRAETERLVKAGETTEMERAMSMPRICRACAQVWPGGGHCTGTRERPHREITMYASNE